MTNIPIFFDNLLKKTIPIHKSKKAISIIEIAFVVLIVGIVLSIAWPALNNALIAEGKNPNLPPFQISTMTFN